MYVTNLDDFIRPLGGLIFIILIFLVLFWFYRANTNIRLFGAKDVYSPRMAVIWWLIPFANLWKPYKIAQEIWNESNPETVISNDIKGKDSNLIVMKHGGFPGFR